MFNFKNFGCHIGGVVGFTSVIGAAVFVGGEYYFENVPSVKSRKHYVLIDLGFSGKNRRWETCENNSEVRFHVLFYNVPGPDLRVGSDAKML